MIENSVEINKFRLTDNFIEKYKNVKPPFGFNGLGELAYMRTYSRIKENGKNEKWFETVRRVVEGVYNMQKEHIIKYNLGWSELKAQYSAQEMYDRIFNMKFLPPGRGLWAMGTNITEEKGLFAALNNCSYVSTENLKHDLSKPFEFLMDMSMLGVGVGFDTKGAGQIVINEPKEQFEEYKIPDTREGWVESLKLILQTYFCKNKKTIAFDYSYIRPKGDIIKTFGGKASGSDPLIKLHEDIRKMFEGRDGDYITETDIVDIMNMIGVAVVAGNVRRTAEISFGSPESEEYLRLKDYEYNKDGSVAGYNSRRAEHGWASNNSVFATIGMDYSRVAKQTATNGEPGYAWLENMQNYGRMKDNPDYKDYRVKGGNPCLTGDTIVAVADGRNGVTIKELAKESNGKNKFPVYSANKSAYSNQFGKTDKFKSWKTEIKDAVAFYTGKREVVEIVLSDGSSFKCTPDHEIATKDGRWVYAKDVEGECIQNFYSFSNKNSNKNYRTINSKTNGHARQYRMIWEYYNGEKPSGYDIDHISGVASDDSIDNLQLLDSKTHSKKSAESKIGGNNPINRANKDLKSYHSKRKIIDINAKRYNWSEDRRLREIDNFYAKNEKPEIEDKNVYYGASLLVEEVVWNDEYEHVYDLTVEDNSNFYIITNYDDENYMNSSGLLVHNCLEQSLESYELCCLVETFPSKHESKEDFIRTLKFAYLYAKTVTLGQTHWPETNRVMLRNRRIGTSQSGIVMAISNLGIEDYRKWCDEGYNAIEQYDEEYSNWLCIPRSVKKTSVKPSGTVSLLPGVTPGMHFPESNYYIRRVNIAKNSDLVDKCKKAGYKIEDSVYDSNSVVVEIPVNIEGVRTIDNVSMWEQLSLAAFLQKYWADNQVSCTVTFTKNEAKDIENALNYFQYQLKGVSMLPKLEDKTVYSQMPYEQISKEEYEKKANNIKELDFSDISEDSVPEKYCDSDSCEI